MMYGWWMLDGKWDRSSHFGVRKNMLFGHILKTTQCYFTIFLQFKEFWRHLLEYTKFEKSKILPYDFFFFEKTRLCRMGSFALFSIRIKAMKRSKSQCTALITSASGVRAVSATCTETFDKLFLEHMPVSSFCSNIFISCPNIFFKSFFLRF